MNPPPGFIRHGVRPLPSSARFEVIKSVLELGGWFPGIDGLVSVRWISRVNIWRGEALNIRLVLRTPEGSLENSRARFSTVSYHY